MKLDSNRKTKTEPEPETRPVEKPEPTEPNDAPEPDMPEIIVDPTTKKPISTADVDALITLHEKMKTYRDQSRDTMLEIEEILFRMTEDGDDAQLVTRRLKGKTRTMIISLASVSWEQSILLEAWNSYPKLRNDTLKINTIGVKAKEYKKMTGTTGDKAYTQFKKMITAADRDRTGKPSFKIEK